MKLKTLRIHNFRCYKSLEVAIDSMHALVGSNNAGKSTVLRAMDFLFNPSTKKIGEEAFYQKDATLTIEVEGLFSDLNDEEKESLAVCLRPDGTFHMKRAAKLTLGNDEGGPADDDGEGKVTISTFYSKPQAKLDWLNPARITGAAIDEWWANKATLAHNGKSFGDTLGTKKPTKIDWISKAAEFVTANLKPEDMEDEWIDNPKGYSGVLKAALPHFELIPAVRDASDESKVTKTNPFGRLIYEIMSTLDEGLRGELENALKATTVRLNRDGREQRAPKVAEIESTIRGFLAEVMPADVELEFQAPTVEVLMTTPKIHVDDGFKGSVEGKGHGLQRAVIFSILRAYAKLVTVKPDKAKRTLILGVEEPELYMHPTAQRTIRKVLRAIADGGDQVLFCTHSPLMVDVAYFDEIVRIEGAEKPAADAAVGVCPKRHQLTVQALIDNIIADYPHLNGKVSEQSMRERYSHAYTASRNEGFFAKRIILVEGQTEVYSLPIYAAAMGKDLDALGVAVVECGGKGQMDRLYRVFNELGIVCYPVFDYDKGNSDSEVLKASSELLSLLGRPDIKDPATAQVTDRFTCFSVKWETDLKLEIAEYDKIATEAKKALGVTEAKNPLVSRYIAVKQTTQNPPVIPATIRHIIDKALAATHPGTCLKKSAAAIEVKPEAKVGAA